jgi:uncharacterized cupin superfamily protein
MLPEMNNVLSQELEKLGVHKMALENSLPETAIKNIFSENGHSAGVWECSPGKYRLERQTDEFFVLLAGHWQLIGDDGDEYDLKAGDTLLLRKGWKGIAHIMETIRKVYITWD